MKTRLVVILSVIFFAYPPLQASEKYALSMKDGTILVGTIEAKSVKFNASYGSLSDIAVEDIVSYTNGFLQLSDGAKLKGTLVDGKVVVKTGRGDVSIAFESVTGIARQSKAVSSPTGEQATGTARIQGGDGGRLTGRVVDCFNKPLVDVLVGVRNTRFTTKTDSQGEYSLGYVPGTIEVNYAKEGFYKLSLQLQIASISAYPVQDMFMFKNAPGKGLFLVGEDDYIPLKAARIANAESKDSGPLNENRTHEDHYRVSGQPLNVKAGRELVFLDTLEQPACVLRMKPNLEFYGKVRTGLMDFDSKLAYEIVPEQVIEIAPKALVRKLSVSQGGYTFVGFYGETFDVAAMMGSITGPCYAFQVGDTSDTAVNSGSDVEDKGLEAFKKGTYHGSVVDSATAADLYEKAAEAQGSAFDERVKVYSSPYEIVWEAVSNQLVEQKENVVKSDKQAGVLETKMTSRGVFGFPYWEKLRVAIEKSSDGTTKVSLKMFRFNQVNDYSKGEGKLVAQSKSKVNPKADAFLEKLDKRLAKRPPA